MVCFWCVCNIPFAKVYSEFNWVEVILFTSVLCLEVKSLPIAIAQT